MVVDEKGSAFVKRAKLNKSVSVCADPDQNHTIACVFRLKYNQNYGIKRNPPVLAQQNRPFGPSPKPAHAPPLPENRIGKCLEWVT
jgi:hypothetical protein